MTIRKLLVANRGEIARRVFRTARAMGVGTVAVYSEPDAHAPHVTDADFAVALGGSTSAQSYLDIAKVLAAVRASGADAVHPGYGFLSENAEFAQACIDAGITFVGPSPDSMTSMGLKDRAKQIARDAGVPVLPDALLTGDDPQAWADAAADVGYPLLIKATAGGGGKGMRLVRDAADLTAAVRTAAREAASSFGNGTVFCERYLQPARHIEIQVAGDTHGGAMHFGERECSVQRRHQKVVEEAPSPVIDEQTRAAMGDASVALVRALGYVGVGTIEYLYDDSTGDFFFLEMNTRLQVEHPVTEEVTGYDLVRLQLGVAAGDRLPAVARTPITGHAIEVRLYAEDPARDYLPTPGPLWRYRHAELAGIRYEDGIAAPGEVSTFYDPMLAKVVAHAPTRAEAAAKLAAALDQTLIHGTTTNREFLTRILRDPDFLAGRARTDFLDLHPELAVGSATLDVVHLAAACAVTAARRRSAPSPARSAPGFRILPGSPLPTQRWLDAAGDSLTVGYRLGDATGDTTMMLDVDGVQHDVVLLDLTDDSVRVRADGVDHACHVFSYPDGSVWVAGPDRQTRWHPQPRLPVSADADNAGGSLTQIAGTVVAVDVAVGDQVEAGQIVAVIEAMKLEHPVRAAHHGVVESVRASVGQYVEAGAQLVSLVAEATS